MDQPDTPQLPMPESRKTALSRSAHALLAAAMVLGILGGPCAMQDVMGESAELPSKEEYVQRLSALKVTGIDSASKEQSDAIADASLSYLRARQAVSRHFATPSALFGGLLVFFYMAMLILAVRTWRYGNDNAVLLSKAAMGALPVRVAVAAVEYTSALRLRPAVESLFMALMKVNGAGGETAAPEVLSTVGHDVGGAYMAFFWLRTAAAVFLIYAIHLTFGRADVQALFLREPPPGAGEPGSGNGRDRDDDDDDGGFF